MVTKHLFLSLLVVVALVMQQCESENLPNSNTARVVNVDSILANDNKHYRLVTVDTVQESSSKIFIVRVEHE